MVQDITLYRIQFSSDVQENKHKTEYPIISLEFKSDDDLFNFLINNIAFISNEEKTLFTMNLHNIRDEERFAQKLLEEYNKHIQTT